MNLLYYQPCTRLEWCDVPFVSAGRLMQVMPCLFGK